MLIWLSIVACGAIRNLILPRLCRQSASGLLSHWREELNTPGAYRWSLKSRARAVLGFSQDVVGSSNTLVLVGVLGPKRETEIQNRIFVHPKCFFGSPKAKNSPFLAGAGPGAGTRHPKPFSIERFRPINVVKKPKTHCQASKMLIWLSIVACGAIRNLILPRLCRQSASGLLSHWREELNTPGAYRWSLKSRARAVLGFSQDVVGSSNTLVLVGVLGPKRETEIQNRIFVHPKCFFGSPKAKNSPFLAGAGPRRRDPAP